ncbi:MAG: STAS domain-containing protein [Planctomycetota bacterium]|nr:STAS domain-containing protein [Planctomycetota bacterium]
MSDKKRITVVNIGDLATVRFNDTKIVDSANIEEMGEELSSLVESDKIIQILLIFDGVEFLSSAALNKLILIERKVKEAGGNLRLCALREEIKEVFTITRLDRIFDIRDSESDGLKAFGVPPQ